MSLRFNVTATHFSSTVRTLYGRISQDPRHDRVNVLLEEYIAERSFPDWSMGFHRLSSEEMKHLDGFTSFAELDQFLPISRRRRSGRCCFCRVSASQRAANLGQRAKPARL